MATKQVLVVDDDAHIREVVVFALEKAGMNTVQAADGAAALQSVATHKPDIIILDISMPEMDGLDVCRTLRRSDDTPILFLSSRDDEIDRIIGLEIGGDDYVTKPFSPRELVARVKAILKRKFPTESTAHARLTRGKVVIDPISYTATCNTINIALTATEFTLLLTLFRHPEKVFTRNELMDHTYGIDVTVSDRTIDSHIRRIRAKFSAAGITDIITTNHGIGYVLGAGQ